MTPSERHRIHEELSWLHEDPKRAAELLTELEAREILKRGFVPAPVWEKLRKRLAEPS